ncbi:MAG: MBL fold metallo-hydrolase [Thaumarchaeota archaeon]|nr:MBL fold metallo-hydrolase [Nitrososphaerota archaeon]
MTKTIFSILLITTILLTGATVASIDLIQFAEAIKSQGTGTSKYGSSTNICGLQLCSEIPGGKDAWREQQKQPTPVAPVTEESMMEEEATMKDQTISSSVLKYIQEPPTIDPEKGYFVVEIADGLYWLNDFAYQVMFLTTGEGVIVVDVPPSMGENILNAIAEVTDEPVTHVIYSHIHKDHIGAANIFPDTVTIIAHKDTATHLAMKNDPGRPVPTITFDDTYTLSVGDQILELSYVGAFHSKGDILIYASQQKVLMAVDIFHPSHAPFKNFAITKDINNYILVHDKMLEYDFDAIISGHQQILGTSDDVKTNKEFTLDVLNNTIQGFQTWDFMEVAQQYGSEGMLTIFSKYIDLVTSTCVDLTLEKWEDRLNDVSIFVEGNCDSMFFYAFID